MNFSDLVRPELIEVENCIYSMIPKEPSEVYGLLPGFIQRGGKRIRPLLTLLSSMAVGGNQKKAIKTAALIELFHNFTLIHDDIEDNSQMRRGEPTLNVKYGIPIALNSGDALYTILWKEAAYLDEPPEKVIEIQKMLYSAFLRVVEGQGIELNWYKTGKIDVGEEEYYTMVGGKTGALVAVSCEMGAYLGGADKKTREKFYEFGYNIGVAFQIQDDVLNVTGEFEKYKKEIGGDIREGKRTLMVAKAFEKANSGEKAEIKRILLSNAATQKEISYITSIFNKYGAIDYAKEKAREKVETAKAILISMRESIRDSKAKDALMETADFVLNREV